MREEKILSEIEEKPDGALLRGPGPGERLLCLDNGPTEMGRLLPKVGTVKSRLRPHAKVCCGYY